VKKTFFIGLGISLALTLWLTSEHKPIVYKTADKSKPLHPVVIYTTDWCNYCTALRTTLKQYHISYHDYDVEHSEKGRTDYKNMGASGVPILVIGDTILRGYDGQELTDTLVEYGYEIPTSWE